MIYIITRLILLCVIIFHLISCKNSSQSNVQIEQSKDKPKTEMKQTADNSFNDLRNMALAMTPEQLNLRLPNDKTKVYGVVMDWDLGEGVATLVAFQTGDASFYLSSGGGVIGGGQHDNVKRATVAYVDKAQTYLSKTTKTETTSLPDKDGIKFYLLTNNGKFIAQEQMKNIENNSSAWLELFEEGNKVITELRLTTENK